MASDVKGRSKRMITMETKLEIIKKYEEGMRIDSLVSMYGRNQSTIGRIIKNKGAIKASERHPCRSCGSPERRQRQRQLQEAPQEFKASHGWFDCFRKRTGIHSVVKHGETAGSDNRAAEEFLKTFEKVMSAEGYIPQQVFNCDENCVFWKKMPRCIFITAEERKLPVHKPMKNRLTLAFCANASGDLKIKPLLVYHSENYHAFKAQNITKKRLSVFWMSNAKVWVTRAIFIEWVKVCFGPAVQNFLEENNLPLKCLQRHFDIVQCLMMIDKAWNEVSWRTLNSSWMKLLPAVVAERDFEDFDPSTKTRPLMILPLRVMLRK
ncbi:tigger transposable element-derived protein 1-like [Palaemon carinicauda]|uniref:tigger transposable element-derived protein 1-like n=1 Tax=Palaemon carinicauda TaxID=392227 RepID=UPI0035B589FD